MVDRRTRERTLKRIRNICLALPETSERLSHGSPTEAYAEVAPPRLVEAARLGARSPAQLVLRPTKTDINGTPPVELS